MKSIFKRLTCAGLAAVLCISVLGGCGKKKDSKTNSGAVTATDLDDFLKTVPEKLKGTTIEYFTWYDVRESENSKDSGSSEWKVIKQFEQKTGIKVNVTIGSYEKFLEQTAVKVSTGESPDVVRLRNNGISSVKALQPLKNTGFDFSGKDWDQATLKDFTYGGEAFAVNVSNPMFYDGIAVAYNSELFEDNDLDDPWELYKKGKWTWKAFEKICEEFGKIGDGYIGASFCPFNLYSLAHGTDFLKYDGQKFTNNMSDPVLASTWRTTLEWLNKGYISREVWQMGNFMSGKVGLFFGNVGGFATKQSKTDPYRRYKIKDTMGVVPMPVDDDKSVTNYQALIEYCAWGVPKGAKNPEAVPYLLRYILDRSVYSEDATMRNEQCKETFDAIVKNPNRAPMTSAGTISADSGLTDGDIQYRLKSADPQQIATVLQTYSGVVDDAVAKANEQINQMK